MEERLRYIKKKNIFIAGVTVAWPWTEEAHDSVINTYMDNAGYKNTKFYCMSSSISESDVKNSIKSGAIFLVYAGHGSQTSWSAGDFSLHGSEVKQLSNTTSYPF